MPRIRRDSRSTTARALDFFAARDDQYLDARNAERYPHAFPFAPAAHRAEAARLDRAGMRLIQAANRAEAETLSTIPRVG